MMSSQVGRPKVLLIHTGGTLGMPLAKSGETLRPPTLKDSLKDPLNFLKKIADIEVKILWNLDSSDIVPKNWQELARVIDRNLDQFQGMVIVHGTDTLAWTATALSFMLSGLPIPVVLTGSQRPLTELRSDARRNLLNSVQVAVEGPPGVMVVFGDRILRGSAVTKDSIFHFDAFRSNNSDSLGRIGLDIHWRSQKKVNRQKYWKDSRLETQIGLVSLFPGFSPHACYPFLESEWKAVVIEGFGAGNIPLGEVTWENVLLQARDKKIPVVVTTACRHGRVNPTLYVGGQRARELGASFAFGMTREAAVIKAMVLLGRKVTYRKFSREFERNWCGEIGAGEIDSV